MTKYLLFLITIVITCRSNLMSKEKRLDYSSLGVLNDLTRGIFLEGRRSIGRSESDYGSPSHGRIGFNKEDYVRTTRGVDGTTGPSYENKPSLVAYTWDQGEDNYARSERLVRNVPSVRSNADINNYVARAGSYSNAVPFVRSNYVQGNYHNVEDESGRRGNLKKGSESIRITPIYRSITTHVPTNHLREETNRIRPELEKRSNMITLPHHTKVLPGTKPSHSNSYREPELAFHVRNAYSPTQSGHTESSVSNDNNNKGRGSITIPNEAYVDIDYNNVGTTEDKTITDAVTSTSPKTITTENPFVNSFNTSLTGNKSNGSQNKQNITNRGIFNHNLGTEVSDRSFQTNGSYEEDVHNANEEENVVPTSNLGEIHEYTSSHYCPQCEMTKQINCEGNTDCNRFHNSITHVQHSNCEACKVQKERQVYEHQKNMCDFCKIKESERRERYENIKITQIRHQCEICKIKMREMQTHCELCIVREAEMHSSCEQCTYRDMYTHNPTHDNCENVNCHDEIHTETHHCSNDCNSGHMQQGSCVCNEYNGGTAFHGSISSYGGFGTDEENHDESESGSVSSSSSVASSGSVNLYKDTNGLEDTNMIIASQTNGDVNDGSYSNGGANIATSGHFGPGPHVFGNGNLYSNGNAFGPGGIFGNHVIGPHVGPIPPFG